MEGLSRAPRHGRRVARLGDAGGKGETPQPFADTGA